MDHVLHIFIFLLYLSISEILEYSWYEGFSELDA